MSKIRNQILRNYYLIVISNFIYFFLFSLRIYKYDARANISTPRMSVLLFCNIASFTSRFPTNLREITPADDDSVKVVA